MLTNAFKLNIIITVSAASAVSVRSLAQAICLLTESVNGSETNEEIKLGRLVFFSLAIFALRRWVDYADGGGRGGSASEVTFIMNKRNIFLHWIK